FASLQPGKQDGSPAALPEPSEKIRQGSHFCHVCSNRPGLIWKYGLDMCHQCF
ncbi:hypothetical protein DBR06_SOUSAS6610278, partial [Sousa chinensis]